jgi:hypothetical protein
MIHINSPLKLDWFNKLERMVNRQMVFEKRETEDTNRFGKVRRGLIKRCVLTGVERM